MPTTHPCGNLPVTGVHASLWYCHHHQAWRLMTYTAYEDGGPDPLVTFESALEFGPLDNRRAVFEELLAMMTTALAAV